METPGVQNVKLASAALGRQPVLKTNQTTLAQNIATGNVTPDRFPGLNLLSDLASQLLSKQTSVDHGIYVDIYDHQAEIKVKAREEILDKENDPEFRQRVDCPPTDNETLTLAVAFSVWTGLYPEGLSPDGTEYRAWTASEMENELLKVKAFLHNDLSKILQLTGIMAEINDALFPSDLDKFSELELMAYGTLFHFNFEALEFLQESLNDRYAALQESGSEPAELEKLQKTNEAAYISQLKSLILENKIWILERLRLWKWREEVLLGRAESMLEQYPGMAINFDFETTAELLEIGLTGYFLRVGEAKREELMENYHYFDLYHMAGVLAVGVNKEVAFTTDMLHEDLADLIITLLEELEINPRYLLSPLGVYVINNAEKGEVLVNMFHKPRELNEELLLLGCSHAGIETSKSTEIEFEDGTTTLERTVKPIYVLREELTAQYMSPQFYTGVESHRYYLSALNSFHTLSGGNVTNGKDGDFLFYGIGDGLSTYRVYRPLELATVFHDTLDFIDPYSLKKNPFNPLLWSRFSLPSIQRLVQIVIPQLKTKINNNAFLRDGKETSDIAFLEQSIFNVFTRLDSPKASFRVEGLSDSERLEKKFGPEIFQSQTLPLLLQLEQDMEPKQLQARNIALLREKLDLIREPFMGFIAYLFQLGTQFLEWENSTQIDQRSLAAGMDSDRKWRHFDPETSNHLVVKIFNMLTTETEQYFKIVGSDDVDYTPYVKALRFVRFYDGAYRIDWHDELSTISGLLYLMISANNLSYYHYLQTTGSWLVATANYYALHIADIDIGETELVFTEEPIHPQ